ncbi:MAG: dihydropteroate synthase [Chitinophagaceae bacterium]
MYTFNCRGTLRYVDKPVVMGILNITPDSFYAESRVTDTGSILQQAEKMLKAGAVILDIGGQSTRPGSEKISAQQELERVLPAIEEVSRHFPECWISIDTYYASVAKAAVHAGATLVNDISAGLMDPQMLAAVAQLQVPYILMHMKGTPQTMQENPEYNNVTREVMDYFIERVAACRKAGITDLILDPGFGFGKSLTHNFTLLKNLPAFQALELPVLAGLSRKSMVSKPLKIRTENALNGTTVLNTLALLNGATLLRVHDVQEAVEAIDLIDIYRKS